MAKDQTTILAEHGQMEAELVLLRPQVATITGDKTKLVAGATIPTDLVSAGNSILALTGERDTAKAEVTRLTGDKTKLAAAATLPADLVSAGNDIQRLTAENAQLKAEKTTVERAVATKMATLGIAGTTPAAATTETAKAPAFNPDAKILAARGVKTVEELNAKMDTLRAQQAQIAVV